MSIPLQELRYALRLLGRSPGFTLVAVLALASGMGADTAIFSVVNGVLLRPLPFSEPDRLAAVWEHNVVRSHATNVVSPENLLHWRESNQTFERMAALGLTFRLTLTGAGDPVELPMQRRGHHAARVLRGRSDRRALAADRLPGRSAQPRGRWLTVLGRLKPGVTVRHRARLERGPGRCQRNPEGRRPHGHGLARRSRA